MQFRSDMTIALGSNQQSSAGMGVDTLKTAISRMEDAGATIRATSPFYATPCFPAGAGPDYVNAVVAADWDATPHEVLEALHKIEADLGRERTQRWGSRTADLDLIFHGTTIAPDIATHDHWRGLPLEAQMTLAPSELILPHPRLQDRAFVLVPLADVAPDWVHPILDQSVTQMLAALDPDLRAEVRIIAA